MDSIAYDVSGTVTRDQMPLKTALLSELRTRAAALGSRRVPVSHRPLAKALGCSPSYIPHLIQTLLQDGQIDREPYKNTYVLTLIDQSDAEAEALIDQFGDEPEELIDQLDQESDLPRPNDANTLHSRERVKMSCMDDHEIHDQEEEESCTPPEIGFDQDLYQRLLTEPGMNTKLAKQIASNPPGTVTDFEHDLVLAGDRRGVYDPFYYAVSRWKEQQRVCAQEVSGGSHNSQRSAEHRPAGRMGRRDSGTYRTSPARGRQPASGGAATDYRERYADLLAEFANDPDDECATASSA